jgi:hypothetical protein
MPTYVQLERLAYEILRRSVAVFFYPEPPDEAPVQAEFRARSRSRRSGISSDRLRPSGHLRSLWQFEQLSASRLIARSRGVATKRHYPRGGNRRRSCRIVSCGRGAGSYAHSRLPHRGTDLVNRRSALGESRSHCAGGGRQRHCGVGMVSATRRQVDQSSRARQNGRRHGQLLVEPRRLHEPVNTFV